MPEQPSTVLVDDGMCFGCGPENPIGLHLSFSWAGDQPVTHWTPSAAHQGWAGRAHGGIIALVLDEIVSRAALAQYGMTWVTAELTTRMLRPAFVGVPLTGRAWVRSTRSRLIVCEGELREAAGGTLVATGLGKMMPAVPTKEEVKP